MTSTLRLSIASLMLGILLSSLLLTIRFASAHVEDQYGQGGDHTLGPRKDLDAPGGFGTWFQVEVNKDTSIDSFSQWAFIRARVQLRKPNNDPVIQTGWQDYGCDDCGGSTPLRVFTQKGVNGAGQAYPSYSLTNHNFYSFRVSECDGDSCAKAYIYYGGSWNLLDSSQNSPNCGCIEKAGTWVFLDFYDGLANSHPNFSGGISFREGKIKKSDGSWYPWAHADFPLSGWVEEDPSNAYRRCDSTPWTEFTIKKSSC